MIYFLHFAAWTFKLGNTKLVHWSALCFCYPQVAGSDPIFDGQGCGLFGEIARHFFIPFVILMTACSRV